MESFFIRPLSESDIDAMIASAGGRRAHPDADRRREANADYLVGDALIELKSLEDEGLAKPERQAKLAALFRREVENRPVIVLDPQSLSAEGRREYNRILEGPIKTAVRSARGQLKQSRTEHASARTSVLFLVNNGYTALNHDALSELVANRVRNDTNEIDGIVVGGCYYYSDTFDSFFFWPIDYLPINLDRPFPAFDRIRQAWNRFAETFMTELVRSTVVPVGAKGPVVDAQFDIDDVTYVKPAPPIGGKSGFFANGRPRKNSGFAQCPPVATTFPDLNRQEWSLFREAFPYEGSLRGSYERWQAERLDAAASGTTLMPFVAVSVTFKVWNKWRRAQHLPKELFSLPAYANSIFEREVRARIISARERNASVLPSRYILALTEEIGQDCHNDLSHIASVREVPQGKPLARVLVRNERLFHEHALAIAAAYAFAEGVDCVLWEKDRRYGWF